jgi:hypothetical protein
LSQLDTARRTGIDQFLLRGLPSFLLGNLFFDLANLSSHSGQPRTGSDAAMAGSWETAGTSLTVSVGSASMVNFCCLRSCGRQRCQQGSISVQKKQSRATDSESKLHLDATTDSEAATLRRGECVERVSTPGRPEETEKERVWLLSRQVERRQQEKCSREAGDGPVEVTVMMMKRLAACLACPVPLANLAHRPRPLWEGCRHSFERAPLA